MKARHWLTLTLAAVGLLHCAAKTDKGDSSVAAVLQPTRDWTAHPAVVDASVPTDLYAVSDIHGSLDLFRSLLRANHLTDTNDQWTGGAAMLVVAGDLIDKGPDSLQVVDLIRSLEAPASAAGGRVLTTLGNHEAEFFVDPLNSKATGTGVGHDGIDNELDADGIAPASVAACTDAAGRGAWLATLPLAARVGKWFFAHAGNAGVLAVPALETSLESAIDTNGYAGVTGTDSILEARSWYGAPDSPSAGSAQAAALGVEHIVFGHDPNALNDSGRIKSSANGVLIKIDTAMGIPGDAGVGQPFFLHIQESGSAETVEVLDITGAASPVP